MRFIKKLQYFSKRVSPVSSLRISTFFAFCAAKVWVIGLGTVIKTGREHPRDDIIAESKSIVHVDYEKRVSVMKNFWDDEIIHVDYEKHGPIVQNLGDDEVIHVDNEKHVSAMKNLGDDAV